MIFSLIVATLGRVSPLIRLFESLENDPRRTRIELILVDQNPTGHLAEIFSVNWGFRVVHLQSAPGLSQARNIGLGRANGDIICFPDDDCWYLPSTLETVEAVFRSNPNLSIVLGKTVDSKGVESLGRFMTSEQFVSKQNVWLAGNSNSLFVRRSSINDVRFDLNLGVGSHTRFRSGEETDFILQLLDGKESARFFPTVQVGHEQVARNSEAKFLERARDYSAGFGYVLRKHNFSLGFMLGAIIRPGVGALWAIADLDIVLAKYKIIWALGVFNGWLGFARSRISETAYLPGGRDTSHRREIVFFSSHLYSREYRKTSVHHVADAFYQLGFTVHFVTVGQSVLKRLLRPDLSRLIDLYPKQNKTANIKAIWQNELFHPPSFKNRFLLMLTAPFVWHYGKRLSRQVAEVTRRAAVIVVEGGYGNCYADEIHNISPYSKKICLLNDRLSSVGFREEIVRINQSKLSGFDLVRVPAPELQETVQSAQFMVVAQGVCKKELLHSSRCPYSTDRKAIVCVGNMLIDANAIHLIAAAADRYGADLHLIGRGFAPSRDNIIVHGELGYAETIGFMQHADAGLAPYQLTHETKYVAKSSLKLPQYRFLGLPIIIPFSAGVSGENTFTYSIGNCESIDGAVSGALRRGRSVGGGGELDWSEVVSLLLSEIGLSDRISAHPVE